MNKQQINLTQRALCGAPAEARLLLACARGETIAGAEIARLGVAEGARLLDLAEQHGLTPLLYRALPAADTTAPALAGLRERYTSGVRESLLLAAEMVRLTALLEAAGIATVPFKGPALAAYAYGDLALRPAGDLDLLIRRGDFARARRLVLGQGFEPVLQLGARDERVYLAEHNDFAFEHPTSQLILELQWRVIQTPFAFPPDVDAWWQRLARADLAGRAVRAFAPEDLLLILCIHGGKHAWERLLWVCDIAALLRARPQIDWQRVFALARIYRSRRMLRLGLLLARELCAAPLPGAVLADLGADERVAALAGDVAQQLFEARPHDALLDEKPLFYLRARESLPDRLRILWACYPNLRHPMRLWLRYSPRGGQLRQHSRQLWRRLVGP